MVNSTGLSASSKQGMTSAPKTSNNVQEAKNFALDSVHVNLGKVFRLIFNKKSNEAIGTRRMLGSTGEPPKRNHGIHNLTTQMHFDRSKKLILRSEELHFSYSLHSLQKMRFDDCVVRLNPCKMTFIPY